MSLDLVNTVLSITSLLVAIGTAIAAHHYFLKSERQRDEELIQEFLSQFSEFKVNFLITERERQKTGAPMDEGERSTFKSFSEMIDLASELSDLLHSILKEQKPITEKIRSFMRSVIAQMNNLSLQMQMFSVRFQTYNNNKIEKLHALNDMLPEIRSLLSTK